MNKTRNAIIILVVIVLIITIAIILLVNSYSNLNTNKLDTKSSESLVLQDNNTITIPKQPDTNNIQKDNNVVLNFTESEKEIWNDFLQDKVIALVMAKKDNINSEISPRDKAEFMYFWAGTKFDDPEKYWANSNIDKDDENIIYVEGEYIISRINELFDVPVEGSDYIDYFTNGYYYLQKRDPNFEFQFKPTLNKVTHNVDNNTYIVNFSSLERNTDADSFKEYTYNIVVTKNVNIIKIVSIERL